MVRTLGTFSYVHFGNDHLPCKTKNAISIKHNTTKFQEVSGLYSLPSFKMITVCVQWQGHAEKDKRERKLVGEEKIKDNRVSESAR